MVQSLVVSSSQLCNRNPSINKSIISICASWSIVSALVFITTPYLSSMKAHPLSLSASLSLYLSVCLSLSISVYLCLSLSVCLSVYLSAVLSMSFSSASCSSLLCGEKFSSEIVASLNLDNDAAL